MKSSGDAELIVLGMLLCTALITSSILAWITFGVICGLFFWDTTK